MPITRRLTILSAFLIVLVPLLIACSGPSDEDSHNQPLTSAPEQSGTTAPEQQATSTDPTAPPEGTSVTSDPATEPAGDEQGADPTEPVTETQTEEPQATDPPPPATATPPPADATQTQGGDTASAGSLLPDHRIIAYYGHPSTPQMGILGEYSKEDLHARLQEQAAEFEAADPSKPVVLAFELIATVAQNYPTDDGTYLLYTGDEWIGEYVDYATAHDMVIILDLQVGLDTIPNQIDQIRHWLELPNVHVAIDPEFSMRGHDGLPDRVPGEVIGEVDGNEVQQGLEMISQIVTEKNLPNKIVVVHQFESDMIYNKDAITPPANVDFVLDMDGFGSPDAKLANYDHFVTNELVEYGGIKLFYQQDSPLIDPQTLVGLNPPPLVVIYQ